MLKFIKDIVIFSSIFLFAGCSHDASKKNNDCELDYIYYSSARIYDLSIILENLKKSDAEAVRRINGMIYAELVWIEKFESYYRRPDGVKSIKWLCSSFDRMMNDHSGLYQDGNISLLEILNRRICVY